MTTIAYPTHDRASDFSDAVVAAYIHEISARHGRTGSRSRSSRERDSLARTSRSSNHAVRSHARPAPRSHAVA
jgi:hypothetical protein